MLLSAVQCHWQAYDFVFFKKKELVKVQRGNGPACLNTVTVMDLLSRQQLHKRSTR